MTTVNLTGVFLADRPLDCNEGAAGDVLMSVTLDVPDADLADYELIEEGKPYREWVVPAALLNTKGKVQIVDEE
jgi:hypothetical protein